MKIGIGKFGVVINRQNSLYNKHGHMAEVFNLVNILAKEHEIFIVSKYRDNGNRSLWDPEFNAKQWNGEKLDKVFILNGPIGKHNGVDPNYKTLEMLKNYTAPVINFLNDYKGDWYYLQPDSRYSLDRMSRDELKHEPKKIITLTDDDFRLDMLWLYNRTPIKNDNKDLSFCLIYNDTNPRRTKKIIEIYDRLVEEKIPVDVYGTFKDSGIISKGKLQEIDYWKTMANYKYTINIATNPDQITSRLWDCLLYDVIGLVWDFDMKYRMIHETHLLRVNDINELIERVRQIEDNKSLYQDLLKGQRKMILPGYLDGSFLLNYFKELINE